VQSERHLPVGGEPYPLPEVALLRTDAPSEEPVIAWLDDATPGDDLMAYGVQSLKRL
jgi:hypothetical protein